MPGHSPPTLFPESENESRIVVQMMRTATIPKYGIFADVCAFIDETCMKMINSIFKSLESFFGEQSECEFFSSYTQSSYGLTLDYE